VQQTRRPKTPRIHLPHEINLDVIGRKAAMSHSTVSPQFNEPFLWAASATPCLCARRGRDSGQRSQTSSRPAQWRVPMFLLCKTNGIEHSLTKPNHPWTKAQVGRMNRTRKEATVQLPLRHAWSIQSAPPSIPHGCSFGKRLKVHKGLTSYEHICKLWTTQPYRFGLNSLTTLWD